MSRQRSREQIRSQSPVQKIHKTRQKMVETGLPCCEVVHPLSTRHLAIHRRSLKQRHPAKNFIDVYSPQDGRLMACRRRRRLCSVMLAPTLSRAAATLASLASICAQDFYPTSLWQAAASYFEGSTLGRTLRRCACGYFVSFLFTFHSPASFILVLLPYFRLFRP